MITIKATFKSKDGYEIRRIPISRLPGEELTFDELCILLERVFKFRIDSKILKYADSGMFILLLMMI
jgi:hypothetical protein